MSSKPEDKSLGKGTKESDVVGEAEHQEAFVMPEHDGVESGVPLESDSSPELTPMAFNERLQKGQASVGQKTATHAHEQAVSDGSRTGGVSIKAKLVLSLTALTLIILTLGGVSFVSIVEINESSLVVTKQYAAAARLAEEVKATVYQIRDAEKDFLLLEEEEALGRSTRFVSKLRVQLDKLITLETNLANAEGRELGREYNKLLEAVESYEQQFAKQIKDVKQARANIDDNLAASLVGRQDLIDKINDINGAVRTILDDHWIEGQARVENSASLAQEVYDRNMKSTEMSRLEASKGLSDNKEKADVLLSGLSGKKSADLVRRNAIKAANMVSEAGVLAAEKVAVAAKAAAAAALEQSLEDGEKLTEVVRVGILITALQRSILNGEIQVARYLQDNNATFATSALAELATLMDIAESIRQSSGNARLVSATKTLKRDVEVYRRGLRAVLVETQRIEDEKVLVDQEVVEQKDAMKNTGDSLLDQVSALSDQAWGNVRSESTKLRNTGENAQELLAIVAVLGAILGLVVLILLPRPILLAINQLLQGAQRVSNGDLTQPIRVSSKDELGQLAGTFDVMRVNLLSLVDRIQRASVQISTTVNEIQAAASQQSSTATEQSTAITQFTATMNEIAQTADQLSGVSGDMASDTDTVAKSMETSSSGASQALDSMTAIGDSTRQTSERIKALNGQMDGINDAVGSIASVADQTTLLSLNAAIEANKAGEMGKGFSVVATEIRRLSDRSIDSAGSIGQMVRDIQRAAESSVVSMDKSAEEIRIGIELVSESSSSLINMNENMQVIRERTMNIASAATEQAQGAREAQSTVGQLLGSANLAQQAARQTSGAAYELTSMAAQLSDAVSAFKT
jgi:methyl-accepting chemotaxis protein